MDSAEKDTEIAALKAEIVQLQNLLKAKSLALNPTQSAQKTEATEPATREPSD